MLSFCCVIVVANKTTGLGSDEGKGVIGDDQSNGKDLGNMPLKALTNTEVQ